MKLNVDGVLVYFPYEYIYPEQLSYMKKIKQSLDARGHCLLEMPSGTGKTISLLSLIVSYNHTYPERYSRLIYCSRTVTELEKVVAEIHRLMEYFRKEGVDYPLVAVSLSARKNLCIHPTISKIREGAVVDGQCHNLTASYVQTKRKSKDDGERPPGCAYYEDFREKGIPLKPGVYGLEELKEYGSRLGWCPYFMARAALESAQIIVYNYHYLIDPRISERVSKNLSRNAVVVFDEAHNIDGYAIECMSCRFTRKHIDKSLNNVNDISTEINKIKAADTQKLQREYKQLVAGLLAARESRDNSTDIVFTNPTLPEEVLDQAVPGCIRSADHFVGFLRRFIEYLKVRMRVNHVISETSTAFLKDCYDKVCIEKKPLQFCSTRLSSMIETLELQDVHNISPLVNVCHFATMVSSYSDGFLVIIEPFDDRTPTISAPILTLTCLDASVALKPVLNAYPSVVITSGTLSPLDMYPKMLDFTPVTMASFTMTLARSSICPLIVSRGSDQVAVTTRFEQREDPAVLRNYGALLCELAASVPDGIVGFFPSYTYMETAVAAWYSQGLLDAIQRHKLVFIETTDGTETATALANYHLACETGRGAVLLSVARGKVSEGIDFTDHLGRCVVMFGIPYVYTQSRILKARLQFLRENYGIRESDFLTFDAMRHAAQCLGRALRGKTDYGIMILADKRYCRSDKRDKLPKWIQAHLLKSAVNLSTDEALMISRKFLHNMAQKCPHEDQLGLSLLTREHLDNETIMKRAEQSVSVH